METLNERSEIKLENIKQEADADQKINVSIGEDIIPEILYIKQEIHETILNSPEDFHSLIECTQQVKSEPVFVDNSCKDEHFQEAGDDLKVNISNGFYNENYVFVEGNNSNIEIDTMDRCNSIKYSEETLWKGIDDQFCKTEATSEQTVKEEINNLNEIDANVDDNSIWFTQNKLDISRCELADSGKKSEQALSKQEKVIDKTTVNLMKCHFCESTAKTEEHLVLHLKAAHPDVKLHRCPSCEYESSSRKDLVEHLKNQHADTLVKCKSCDYITTDRSYLLMHLRRRHATGAEIHCQFCEIKFKNDAVLKRHVKYYHLPSEVFKCKFCEFLTKSQAGLTRHTKTRHGEGDEMFNCKSCTFTTKDTVCLREHIGREHPPVYRCESCGYKTFVKWNLKQHVRNMHENLKKLRCKYCDYLTTSEVLLKMHVKKKHTNLAWFRCVTCGFQAESSESLADHNHYHLPQIVSPSVILTGVVPQPSVVYLTPVISIGVLPSQ